MKRTTVPLIAALFSLCVGSPLWAIIPWTGHELPPCGPNTTGFHTPAESYSDGSIGKALNQSDGPVTLLDKVVIASQADTGGSFFYIEERDRSAGIRVESSAAVSRGSRVSIAGGTTGILSSDGERYVDASQAQITTLSGSANIRPLGMENLSVGGSGGITGYGSYPGFALGDGPYNKGLLVTIWGRVTSVDATNYRFYVDDGIHFHDGTNLGGVATEGIRAQATSGPTLPQTGQYVIVTGVSGSFKTAGGGTEPLVRVRDQSDIVVATSESVSVNPSTDGAVIAAPGTEEEICWNLISVPNVPYWGGNVDPSAAAVFDATKPACVDDDLHANLWRWDTTVPQGCVPEAGSSYITYYNENPGLSNFGPITSSLGYWVRSDSSGTVSYTGLSGPIQTTDRYLKLSPSPASDWDQFGGLALIGYPFRQPQPFASALVTDGYRVLSVAEAIASNWIQPVASYWDNATYTMKTVGMPNSGADDTYLRPWRGYWVRSFKEHLALILPDPVGSLRFLDNPLVMEPCVDEIPVTVELKVNDVVRSGVTVAFSTTQGAFKDGVNTGLTGSDGKATVTLVCPGACTCETAEVTAEAQVDSSTIQTAYPLRFTFDRWALKLLIVSPDDSVHEGYGSTTLGTPVTVMAYLTRYDGTAPISGQEVTLTSSQGAFDKTFPRDTDAYGEVSAALLVTDSPGTVTVTASAYGCGCPVEAVGEVEVVEYRTVDDWPMFMHDIHHTGRTRVNDTDTSKTLYLHWVADLPTATTEFGRYTGGYGGDWLVPDHFRSAGTDYEAHPYFDSSPVHSGSVTAADGSVFVGTYVPDYSGTYTDQNNVTWRVGYPHSSKGRLLVYNPLSSPTTLGGTIEPAWKFPATTRSETDYDGDCIGGIACTPAVTKLINGRSVVVFGCDGYGNGSGGGRVYAVYADGPDKGQQRWVYPADGGATIGRIMGSSPAVSNGIVYIGTESAELLALDVSTGVCEFKRDFTDRLPVDPDEAAKWKKMMGTTSPAVVDLAGEDYVFIGCDNGYVYKVCGANHSSTPGQIVGTFYNTETGAGRFASSPSYRQSLFVGESCGRDAFGNFLFSLNPDDLSVQWCWGGYDEFYGTPAVSDNGVYLGDINYHDFYRFGRWPQDEHPIAHAGNDQTADVYSSAALTSALAYYGDDAGILHARDQIALSDSLQLMRAGFDARDDLWWVRHTGYRPSTEIMLEDSLGGWISSSPALSYAVDGSNQLWVFVTARTPNGVHPGRLYCFGPQPETSQTLRIDLQRSKSWLDPCIAQDSVALTATLVGEGDISGKSITFRTDKGTFGDPSSYDPVHQVTVPVDTAGIATAVLSAIPEEWRSATVEASYDPSNPYSWVRSRDASDPEISWDFITIARPAVSISLSATPAAINSCGISTVTVTVKACQNRPLRGVVVHIEANGDGVFQETETDEASVETDSNGVAVVHLEYSGTDPRSVASVGLWATGNPCGIETYGDTQVSIRPDSLTLTATPASLPPGQTQSHVLLTLTTPSGDGVSGKSVTLTTTLGEVQPASGSTDQNGEFTATLSGVEPGNFAVVEGTTTDSCDQQVKQRVQVDFLKSAQAGDDWPMFMHDARHTGRSWVDDTAGARTLYLRWKADVPTATKSLGRYLIWDDTYIPNHPFVGPTGESVAAHPTLDSSPVYSGQLSPEDGSVFVGAYVGTYADTMPSPDTRRISYPTSSKGRLLAFNPLAASTVPGGAIEPVWKFPLTSLPESDYSDDYVGGIACTPAVIKLSGEPAETIVVFGCEGDGSGTGTGRVYAIHADGEYRGQQKWVYPATGSIGKIMCSSPAVSGNTVYIGTESRELLALNATDGSLLFRTVLNTVETDTRTTLVGTSSPAVVNLSGQDYVFIGCDDGRVYKVGGANHPTQAGVIVAVYPEPLDTFWACVEASPSYRANLYVASAKNGDIPGKGNVFCLDPENLVPIWESGAYMEVRTTPALSANGVYLGDETGRTFYRFSLSKCDQQRLQFEDTTTHIFSSAALTSKLAFTGNDWGELFAFDQTSLANKLYLKQFDPESQTWISQVGRREVSEGQYQYLANSLDFGWVSSSPALAYGLDENTSPWLFVTARSSNSFEGEGTFYCFGPRIPTEPPPGKGQEPVTPGEEAHGGSIGSLKYLPDGYAVEIAGKVVSGIIREDAPVAFYVEETDRSSGMRVAPPEGWTQDDWNTIATGNVVNVTGALATVNGERVLQATQVESCSVSSSVQPVLISMADMGGGPAGYQPGTVLRVPTTDLPNGLSALGVNNVGLLVRVYGRVTGVMYDGEWEGTHFYVDDGSDVYFNPADNECMDTNFGSDVWDGTTDDWGGNLCGVMVTAVDSAGQPFVPVQLGRSVSIVGIVGARVDSEGRVLPVLRPRSSSDITLSPDTTTLVSPSGQILRETGSDRVWNVLSLPLPILLNTNSYPYPPDAPASVILGHGYLGAWCGYEQQAKPLYADYDSHDIPLGNARYGYGYWFRMTEADSISYTAVNDDTTDRWVSLPFNAGNMLGYPLAHSTQCSDMIVTDGRKSVKMAEAAGALNWLDPTANQWSSENQEWSPFSLALDAELESWNAYYTYAYQPVSVIVPGTTEAATPRGSILATVEDAIPNPIPGARVYCKWGSAVTATDGTALIENLPVGTYLVTASASGYRSKSQAVVVPENDQAEVGFTLASRSGIVVSASASPGRIPPDGETTSTISAWVRDLEGGLLANKEVAFATDAGVLSATSATTNSSGVAQVTLTSGTDPDTATVTATCEGVSARTYVEFADEDAPSIRITDPSDGAGVSGVIMITASAHRNDATGPCDFRDLELYVDDSPVGAGVRLDTEDVGPTVDTRILSNGTHTLRACATNRDGSVSWSQRIRVSMYNALSELVLSQCELFTDDADPGVIELTGAMNESGDWAVKVLDSSDTIVFSGSGSGPGPIDVVWDGKLNGSYLPGSYRVQFLTPSSGEGMGLMSSSDRGASWPVTVSQRHGTVLITTSWRMKDTKGSGLQDTCQQDVQAVVDQCFTNDIHFTLIADPQWRTGWSTNLIGMGHRSRRGMRDWLRDPFKCWFNVGHGDWEQCVTSPPGSPARAHLRFCDMRQVCGRDFQDLGLPSGQYMLVQLNSCHSGGWDANHLDASIAQAFGMYGVDGSGGGWSDGQCYLGWWADYTDEDPYNGSDWTSGFWRYFGEGYSVSQAQLLVLIGPGGYSGTMHESLVTVGDPYTVWITDLK